MTYLHANMYNKHVKQVLLLVECGNQNAATQPAVSTVILTSGIDEAGLSLSRDVAVLPSRALPDPGRAVFKMDVLVAPNPVNEH